MSSFELIKDIDGNNYLSLEKLKKEDASRIGSKLDDFEILKQLGGGEFYKIYKVRSKINKQVYAIKKFSIKKIKENNTKLYQSILLEIKLISELIQKSNNVNIIKYYNYFEEGDFLYILIEYVGNGNMKSFIEAQKKVRSHI